MPEQTLLYIIALTTAGLVGKIVYDWLRNRKYVSVVEFELFKDMILKRLDAIEKRLERIENILMKERGGLR